VAAAPVRALRRGLDLVLEHDGAALHDRAADPHRRRAALARRGLRRFSHYTFNDFVPNLLGIALIPGLLALLLYYRALSKTPASLATIAEMAFPVAATLISAAPAPGDSSSRSFRHRSSARSCCWRDPVLGWTKEKTPPVTQRGLSNWWPAERRTT